MRRQGGIMVMAGVLWLGTAMDAMAQSEVLCEQIGKYTRCREQPERRRFDSEPANLHQVLPTPEMPQIIDPGREIRERAAERERLEELRRLEAQPQQQALERQRVMTALGEAIGRIEDHCQDQFETGQITTRYAKVACASDIVLPMIEKQNLPIDDILKIAYAKAKIAAGKADRKEISIEELELEEATIESEITERLMQRMNQLQ